MAGPNTITVGGITIERGNGALSFISPVVQYKNVEDRHLQELFKFLQDHPEVGAEMDKFRDFMATALTAYGNQRVEEKGKDKDKGRHR